LRLSLAQYRELAAFAQLSSDLDKATKAQLDRGQQMVELLKQPQYQPMSMEDQVAVIWAATNGYLDGVPVSAIRQFEIEFLQFLKGKYATVVSGLRDRKELTEEIVAGLKKAVEEFKGLFSVK
jgi:F-type H+/Na+-transporting ATPase subunit alpha